MRRQQLTSWSTHQLSRSTRDPPTLQQTPLLSHQISQRQRVLSTQAKEYQERNFIVHVLTTITSQNDLTLFSFLSFACGENAR